MKNVQHQKDVECDETDVICIVSIHQSPTRHASAMRSPSNDYLKRRCIKTTPIGPILATCKSRKFFGGFQKQITDGSTQEFLLGSKCLCLPKYEYEEMHVAQIESIFELNSVLYVECHWFQRISKYELRITDYVDINSTESIEGPCVVFRKPCFRKFFCRNGSHMDGWFSTASKKP